MTCTPETSAQGFCLYHYPMIVSPLWFSVIQWAVLIGFLTLATVWVLGRSRS